MQSEKLKNLIFVVVNFNDLLLIIYGDAQFAIR